MIIEMKKVGETWEMERIVPTFYFVGDVHLHSFILWPPHCVKGGGERDGSVFSGFRQWGGVGKDGSRYAPSPY